MKKLFIYTYTDFSSLLLNVFFQAQIVSKSLAAGASPQTPREKLTALPQTHSCFQGVLLLREGTQGRGRRGGEEGKEREGEEGRKRVVSLVVKKK